MSVNRTSAGPARRALLISAAALAAVPAYAQQSPVPPDNKADIVVTGTRLPAGVRAPTPLTVIGAQAIEDREPATLGEILQQIPSFAGIRPLRPFLPPVFHGCAPIGMRLPFRPEGGA